MSSSIVIISRANRLNILLNANCARLHNSESNIASPSKFIILKRLLTLFDLEDGSPIKNSAEDSNQPSRFIVGNKFSQTLLQKLS